MPFTAREFVKAASARFLLGHPHAAFSGISIDTRTLASGDLFFAIAGPHHDGHDHLEDAVRKGAVGLVIQSLDERLRFDRETPPNVFQTADTILALQQWAAALRLPSTATFIGITGTNGKTTTKEMAAAIFSQAGPTLATRGNLNNHLGLPLTLSRLRPEHRYVVMEMGASREGDIALLAKIGRPMISVITNIGKAHLQGLGSPQGVLKEKRAIWDALPADGTAVINQDDPLLAAAAAGLTCRKLFYGLTSLADVRAENIEEHDLGVRFTLNIRGQRTPIKLPVPGQFQILNALAASAIAHAAGVGAEQIAAGLAAFKPVQMRMQTLPHPSGALLINDAYNANPTSMRASIASFVQGYPKRSRWLVLGDMRELGAGARSEHRELGAWLATQSLDRVYLYGRDTRFIAEALATGSAVIQVKRFRKKRRLIAELQEALATRPAILFKASRSMKLEDVINPLLPTPSGPPPH